MELAGRVMSSSLQVIRDVKTCRNPSGNAAIRKEDHVIMYQMSPRKGDVFSLSNSDCSEED